MAAANPGLSRLATPGAPGAKEAVPATPRMALLHHLARQSPYVAAPIFLSALTIAAMAWREVPPVWALSWLLAVTAVLALRTVLLPRLAAPGPMPESRRMRAALGLSLLNGLVHGSVVGFVPWFNTFELAVTTIVLLFLAAGVVMTNIGYRPLLLVYLLPSTGPIALVWALSGPTDAGATARVFGVVVAVMILLFVLTLLALGRKSWQQHVLAIAARLEQQHLSDQLAVALTQAEAASRAKTSFLAAASHDLRQPMHTLSLFGAALLMRPLDERSREIALHMEGALRVLGSQLDALLDVSRLDAGVVEAELLHFPLGSFVQRLCRDVQPAAEARGLELVVAVDTDQAVRSDPMLLERVLRNLLDNAIKYTEQGRVSVSLRSGGGRFTLAVADTGRGIPVAEQPRVFEEFYQLDNPGRDRAQGLGLGLSIVRRLVDLLGIELELASTVGRGTTVTLRLPVAEPVAMSRVVPPPAPSAAALQGRHVLVIDDEDAVRTGMLTLLEAHGCAVSLAANRDQALAAASARQPDIVLADLRLRGSDSGIDCVQSLRALQPGLPALLISGDTAPERLRQAHTAGLRLLHKPIDIDLLRAAMLQALNA